MHHHDLAPGDAGSKQPVVAVEHHAFGAVQRRAARQHRRAGAAAAATAGSALIADSSSRIDKSSRFITVHLPLGRSGPVLSGVQRV